MFGERPLYGKDILKIDDKGRIFLPKYTRKEKDDELILRYDEEISKYEIYSIDRYNQIMSILEKYAIKSTIKNERLYYKRRICEISKSILKKIKVDSQGRINISGIEFDTNEILCIGAYDHLIIESKQYNIIK